MADFNIDRLLQKGKKIEGVESLWKCLTRQMFHLYSAVNVYMIVDKCLEETSDEQYRWFELPRNKIIREIEFDSDLMFLKNKIKITALADKFNIKPLGKKLRLCPFHADKNPSLSLSDKLGVFNCFGCHEKGDLITFYKKLKELNIKESENGKR